MFPISPSCSLKCPARAHSSLRTTYVRSLNLIRDRVVMKVHELIDHPLDAKTFLISLARVKAYQNANI